MLDIYKTYYNLGAEPFRLSPDYAFSFSHRSYAHAMAYLTYAISQGEGLIAITGAPGTGKTTLIREAFSELDDARFQVGMLTTVQLDPRNFLRMVLNEFGLPLEKGTDASPLLRLQQFLFEQSQRGRQTVLIVDEAQGLSASSLEELRLISNIQFKNRLLLQVFLVGQEGLLEVIHAPGMEHLRQRLVAASRLDPLDLDETVSYVEHRLCQVGWKGTPTISEGVLRAVHDFSGGVPRSINLICNRLLILGGLEKKRELVAEDAKQVIEELLEERLLGPLVPVDVAVYKDFEAQTDDVTSPVRSLPRGQSCVHVEQTRQSPSMTDDFQESAADVSTRTQFVPIVPEDKGNTPSADEPRDEDLRMAPVGQDVPRGEDLRMAPVGQDALSDVTIDDTDKPAKLDNRMDTKTSVSLDRQRLAFQKAQFLDMVYQQQDASQDRSPAESSGTKSNNATRWVWMAVFGLLAALGLVASLDTEIDDQMVDFIHGLTTGIHIDARSSGRVTDDQNKTAPGPATTSLSE